MNKIILVIFLLTSVFYGCSKSPLESGSGSPNSSVDILIGNEGGATSVNLKLTVNGTVISQQDHTYNPMVAGTSYETFTLDLTKGTHNIKVETSDGSVILERDFTLSLDKHYIAVSYLSYQTNSFHYKFSDTPLLYM